MASAEPSAQQGIELAYPEWQAWTGTDQTVCVHEPEEEAVRELTKNEQSELTNVAWHWDEAYQVAFNGDLFVAHRLGYPEHVLTAETPMELREQIRRDYRAWQAGLMERSSL